MRLHVPVALRWSDYDAYGHVNNAEMLRVLEEARVQAFWRTDAPDAAPTAVLEAGPGAAAFAVIARQEIEYLAPIPFLRQPVDVELWIGRLGGASLTVCYQVRSPVGVTPPTLYTIAETALVMVGAVDGRPVRISDEQRAAWQPYVEEPVGFSRR